MSRTVIYCRISKDRTGAGLGVERQAADCKLLAAALGFTDMEVITDNDMGAWSGKRRPGYERLLAGLREGRWDTLICWHIDRLTRSPKDLEELVDVLNVSGVTLHTVKGGEIDLTSPEGRMQARILGTLARYESDHKSDRIRRKLLENAAAGRDHGGAARYGWRDDDRTKLDPEQAGVLRYLTSRIIAGDPIYALARQLNANGTPTAKGAPWATTTIRRLVRRPRNAGIVEYQGKPLVDDAGDYVRGRWEPIVTVDEWKAVCAVLADPERRTAPGNTPCWLLSSIARCGVAGCGAPMRIGSNRKSGAVYRCSAKDHLSRNATLVDEVVTADIVAWLARDGATFDTPAGPVIDHRAEADAVRLLIAQAEDALLGNPPDHLKGVSLAAIRRNLDKHRARLEELERDEVLSGLPSPVEGVTAANFRGLPLERRRAVVDYLVEVTILPARRGRWSAADDIQVIPKKRR